MEMTVNLILLAVSSAAAFYCVALNRRLGRLMDAERGLGVSISSMSLALDETRSALQAAQEDCRRCIKELQPMLAQSRSQCAELSELTDLVSEMSSIAAADIEGAAAAAIERISRIAAAPPLQNAAQLSRAPARHSRRRDAAEAPSSHDLAQLLG